MARGATTIAVLALAATMLTACSVSTTTSQSQEQSGLDDAPVNLLHDPGATARAMTAIERAVGANPAQTRRVLIYPEYMDVEAQDPKIPEHIDEYEWRDASVSSPEPVHLSGPQEDVDAALFPTTAVKWRDIPTIVRDVESKARRAEPTRIEDATASYLIVERSTSSSDDGRVEITVYLNGPRRSGYAELTANGTLVNLTVS